MLISEEFVVYKYPCKSTSTRHPIAHSFSYIWEKSIKKINKKKKSQKTSDVIVTMDAIILWA
jgi:hypothetical protein